MLADDGHDMNLPTWVDFHVAAPTEEAAEKIAAAAKDLGYETSIEFDDGEDDEELEEEITEPWTCTCRKEIPLQYDGIMGAQSELDEIARPVGGYSDGWGSFGNLEPEGESEGE